MMDKMTTETQARVWAAANDARLRAAVQRTSGLSKGEWVCETCRVIQWEGAVHVVADGRCLGTVPDLLSWAGCGALLEAMQAKGWGYDVSSYENDYGPIDDCYVSFTRNLGSDNAQEGAAQAPTLPAAVARAAAAALGVEEGRA